jgi:hypothetical protein
MAPAVGAATTALALALMGGLVSFGGIAALRAFSGFATPPCAYVQGYLAPADGGEGLFTPVITDTISPDNGGTIIVDATGRRWYRDTAGQPYSARWFGATGNGTTSDSAALAAMPSGNPIILPPGTYSITANVTFSAPVSMAFGAILEIATGVTVAFNNGFTAGITQCFNCAGTGQVTFSGKVFSTGYPEWWGAVADNAAFSSVNLAAINAAIVACPTVLLGPGNYFTSGTVLQQTAHRNVIGCGGNEQLADTATMITVTSSTATVWLIGPSSAPASSSLYQSNNVLQNIGLNRSLAPDVSVTASAGLIVQYTVWTTVHDMYAYQHCVAYLIENNSGGHYNDCIASRTVSGINGTDRFYGMQLTGNTTMTPGLYSLYVTRCVAACSLSLAGSYGMYVSGTSGCNDLFVTQFETSQLAYGAYVNGNGNTGSTQDFYNEDIRFVDCTLDACYIAAYAFGSISLYGAITITGGYAACFAVGGITPAGLLNFSSSMGAIHVTGLQALMTYCPAMPFILAQNSSFIKTKNCIVTECGTSAYSLTNVTGCSFEDQIRNHAVAPNVYCVAVSTGCSRNYFAVAIYGKSGAWSAGYGIAAGAGADSEYNCTGIDPGCIVSAANKLLNNGVAVTTFGTFGTGCLASGVMS